MQLRSSKLWTLGLALSVESVIARWSPAKSIDLEKPFPLTILRAGDLQSLTSQILTENE